MTAQRLVEQAQSCISEALKKGKKLPLKDIYTEQLEISEVEKLLKVFLALDRDLANQYGENYRYMVRLLSEILFSDDDIKRMLNDLNIDIQKSFAEFAAKYTEPAIRSQVALLALMFVAKSFLDFLIGQ